MGTIQQTGISIGDVVEHFEQVLPKSQAEVSIVQQRLIRAGYRKESAIKIFYGCKVLGSSRFCAPWRWSRGLANLSPFFVYALCAGRWDFWLRISGWEE